MSSVLKNICIYNLMDFFKLKINNLPTSQRKTSPITRRKTPPNKVCSVRIEATYVETTKHV